MSISIETAVKERYAAAARAAEPALCCAVQYDPRYLEIIPEEVLQKDYGCGDPSRYLRPGETVLDLGSGAGKICFIAAQVVGPQGRVIGVDMTDEMLMVARRNAPVVAERLGYANVEFRKGRIQDLALDLDQLEAELKKNPVGDANGFLRLAETIRELRAGRPLVGSGTVDTVVSNCVLNLVDPEAKTALFGEIFRVLKAGGRAVISDIVSDQPVPRELQIDPSLWSGCVSGAFCEEEFFHAFERAGFHGLRLLKRDSEPWQRLAGIEFRSVTVEAFKAAAEAAEPRAEAVIYKGPFREVRDDLGRHFNRGEPVLLEGQAGAVYRRPPYAEHFEFAPLALPMGTAHKMPPPLPGPERGWSPLDRRQAGPDCNGGKGACC